MRTPTNERPRPSTTDAPTSAFTASSTRATVRTRRILGVGLVVCALTLALVTGATARALIDTIPSPGADPSRFADSRNPPTFVGVVRETRAFIAVRRSGDEVLIYVCDGRSIFEWLRGRVRGNAIRLQGDVARLRVSARFSRRVVTGVVVRANGRRHEFTARLASKAPAGFHRASATEGVASGRARHQRVRGRRIVRGWIVLPDGRVRGGSTGLSDGCKAKLREILTLQNTISTRDPTQVMNYFDKVSHFRAFCSNSLIAS